MMFVVKHPLKIPWRYLYAVYIYQNKNKKLKHIFFFFFFLHPFLFITGMMNQKKSIVNPTMIGKGDPMTGWETTQIETDYTNHTIGSIQHILMIITETIMATIMTDIMDTITIKVHTMKTIVMVIVMVATMEEDRIRSGIEEKDGMIQEDEKQDLIGDMHLTLIAHRVTGLKQLILNHDKPLSLVLFQLRSKK